jgi:hypothetical protein
MHIYHRPNLTPEQLEILLGLMRDKIGSLPNVESQEFEDHYALLLKLKNTKPIKVP